MEMFEFGSGNPVLLWKPVVEPDFGQERFLTDDPTKLIQRGDFSRVPILAGITKFELLQSAISKQLNNLKFVAVILHEFFSKFQL